MKGFLKKENLEDVKEDGEARWYKIKDIGWVPSVTSVLHGGFPTSYGLIKYFQEHTKEEIVARRDETAKAGLEKHAMFENFARNGFNPKLLTEKERENLRGAIQWAKDMQPAAVLIEETVYWADEEIQVAGRFDLSVNINGKFYIVDLKTGSGIYPSYGAQGSFYAATIGYKNFAVLLLTDTKKGYQWKEFNVEEGLEAFKAAYKLFKYMGGLKSKPNDKEE